METERSRRPYDQRLAAMLVRPLAQTPLRPNHLTVVTAALALVASWLFASAEPARVDWAAGLFVMSRFMDHLDGELARQTGRSSPLGYLLDYLAGGISYAALFAGVAVGLAQGPLGASALLLGGLGVAAALVAVKLNLAIDRSRGGTVGYPSRMGFELEDGIYLLAPVTWLGGLAHFFVAACVGAVVYLGWTASVLARARRDAQRCR